MDEVADSLEALAVAPGSTEVGVRVARDAPFGARTTYRVGGRAAVLVDVAGPADLLAVAAVLAAAPGERFVLGKGSNVLVAEGTFPGVVVVLGQGFESLAIDGTSVVAGAALALPVLARKTAAAGLSGLEWAVGVPGSVGGGVRMNAGGHGSDIAASLVSYRWIDLASGDAHEAEAERLRYGYRSSSVAPTEVITEATFALRPGDVDRSESELREIVRWRREHQPGGSNAGSVFANPDGDAAGRLIEACGWRGRRLGTAEVSEKHANFIQADAEGSAQDVYDLLRAVQAEVAEVTGVSLRTELRLVGFPAEGA